LPALRSMCKVSLRQLLNDAARLAGTSEFILKPADCGVMLEPQLGMGADQVVKTAELAEGLGFGYFFRSDHLLPTDGRRGVDSPECWTTLGAVAARTTKVKFGPLVTPLGFRNPALLAKMASTLHSYSRGRLQLAVGAGWYEPEYRAHGYPFPPFRERLAQLRSKSDAGVQKYYFQTLVPENTEMLELLADTLKDGV
jgi:Luciferase-like monooxygenase